MIKYLNLEVDVNRGSNGGYFRLKFQSIGLSWLKVGEPNRVKWGRGRTLWRSVEDYTLECKTPF